jgi:hypothetical protein
MQNLAVIYNDNVEAHFSKMRTFNKREHHAQASHIFKLSVL